jgi:hypothetical protein
VSGVPEGSLDQARGLGRIVADGAAELCKAK